jgi:hypothetical protein
MPNVFCRNHSSTWASVTFSAVLYVLLLFSSSKCGQNLSSTWSRIHQLICHIFGHLSTMGLKTIQGKQCRLFFFRNILEKPSLQSVRARIADQSAWFEFLIRLSIVQENGSVSMCLVYSQIRARGCTVSEELTNISWLWLKFKSLRIREVVFGRAYYWWMTSIPVRIHLV